MKRISIFFVFVLLVSSAIAQDGAQTINAGVVNGRAVSLPKPAYPEAAKAAGISGVIGVNVVIDEAGNVISAIAELNDVRERRDVDGTKLEPLPADPLLRGAAEEAARKARFSPVMISGSATRVSGKIVYSFVSDSGLAAMPLDESLQPKMPGGGVLNGKATSLPKPEYPAAAKAVRAEGTVTVQITVSEEGTVQSARAVSGHPLLRAASEAAASGATFSPTLLSGQAVKISGVLTYNFVLPKAEDK